MRKPVVYLALAATLFALVAPAAAAPKLAKSKPLVVKDKTGDATGLNSQGGLVNALDAAPSSPVSDAGSDIVSFSIGRKDDGRVVKALVATLKLAAPPSADRNFRIRMSAPGCTTYFLEYDTSSALGEGANLRDNCDPGEATATFTGIDGYAQGNTITWTIPIKELRGEVKLGTELTVLGAQVSVETAVIFPGMDEVRVKAKYVVGK